MKPYKTKQNKNAETKRFIKQHLKHIFLYHHSFLQMCFQVKETFLNDDDDDDDDDDDVDDDDDEFEFEFYWSMLLKQLDQKEIGKTATTEKQKNGTLALPIRQLKLTTRNCTILKR